MKYFLQRILILDENQPCRIVKSLLPKRNRLAFFEVTDKSYHQVAEVLNPKQGTRLSINGWLHGPVNHRSSLAIESLPIAKPANKFQSNDVKNLQLLFVLFSTRFNFQLDRVNQTITPTYLTVENQYDVQTTFQENSEAKLAEFFQVD